MEYTGRVENGVIVLDGGTPLADGTLVRVEPIAAPATSSGVVPRPSGQGHDPIADLTDDEVRQRIGRLPPEYGETVRQIAARYGRRFEDVGRDALKSITQKPRPQVSEAERAVAWARLMRHAGAGRSGDPRSADNDRIDADLAEEYGSSHDEPT
jgi:hypothetical protein